MTTFQAPSIDRLHGLGLPFGYHDSQVAFTLGTGALRLEISSGQKITTLSPG
jgi:hypothetical protein